MFKILRNQVENEAQKTASKATPVRNNQTVFDAIKLSFANLIDEIANLSIYDAAHWVCNIDRWQNNIHSDNKSTYKRGEIIFLDLGAQNFKYEPSYAHACIVLENRPSSILIVPCSTKKYGSGYADIIDATPADGFIRNTGIQSENFRWVSKNRVVSRTGKSVSSHVLDKIDTVIISLAPSNKKNIAALNGEIEKLQAEIKQLKEQIPSDE